MWKKNEAITGTSFSAAVFYQTTPYWREFTLYGNKNAFRTRKRLIGQVTPNVYDPRQTKKHFRWTWHVNKHVQYDSINGNTTNSFVENMPLIVCTGSEAVGAGPTIYMNMRCYYTDL